MRNASTAVEHVPLIKVDTALNSLRSSGYTLEAAVGEPIDNAIEARANHVRIQLTEGTQVVKRGKKEESLKIVDQIAIADDGGGMTPEILERCLVLGESTRYNSRDGMGRFGVGGTLGAISQCRRIEVWSRTKANQPLLYSYIDLDEISEGTLTHMEKPSETPAPDHFSSLLAKGSGTLVVWSKCDRLSVAPRANARKSGKTKDLRSVDRIQAELVKWVARTYRHFLAAGRAIEINGVRVAAHDPLYLMDSRFPGDPKGTVEFEQDLAWPLASDPDTTSMIHIQMTLLPEQWRPKMGSGAETTFNRERRVVDNEPLSIVRANREIFFDIIPRFYPDGVREIARWIGIQISFEPVLDEAFQVRNVKRGVEPVEELRHELRRIIQPAMKTLVERIRRSWRDTENAEKKTKGVHNAAEEIAAQAEKTSVKSRAGRDVSPEERETKLEQIAQSAAEASSKPSPEGEAPSPEQKARAAEEIRERLKAMPFSIVDGQWPGNEFFATEHLGENTIVTYNNKHPFFAKVYSKVLAAASLHSDGEPAPEISSDKLAEIARAIQVGLDLLIVAYAKAEAMDDDEQNQELYSVLRTQWGLFLSQMVQRLPETEI